MAIRSVSRARKAQSVSRTVGDPKRAVDQALRVVEREEAGS